MPDGGNIIVSTENFAVDKCSSIPLEQGKYVKVRIADSGVGIAKENLKRVFEPYFFNQKSW
jgi:signal transduction histidine kinase